MQKEAKNRRKMRAVIQLTDGDPSTLIINEDVPLPQMVSRGLLIRVQYAAMNRMDLLQIKQRKLSPPKRSQ